MKKLPLKRHQKLLNKKRNKKLPLQYYLSALSNSLRKKVKKSSQNMVKIRKMKRLH
jgi:hypothetical protein